MSLHTTIEDDPIQRVHLAVEALNTLIYQALHEESRPVLLLLSGTADPALFRTLECLVPDNVARGLTVTMLDDRFSRAASENKFLQLTQQSSYEDAKDNRVRFIPSTPDERESPYDLAEQLHREIHDWHFAHRDGKIIATMGIGADGSTAGIVPTQTQADFEPAGTNLMRVATQQRIVPTTSLLTDIISSAVVCTTEETEWALREFDKEIYRSELFTLPARVFHQMKDVHLFRGSAELF